MSTYMYVYYNWMKDLNFFDLSNSFLYKVELNNNNWAL